MQQTLLILILVPKASPNLLTYFSPKPKRILVARPDRIGDVVLSTPVFHTLKLSFRDTFVGALVSSYTSPLLEKNPYIDAIIHDDSRIGRSQNFLKQVKKIRSYHFDTALLLMPTSRLAYMFFLAGIPYRIGVGHILYEVITLMHGVSRRKYFPLRHESDYMLDLASKIGAREIWSKTEIFLDDDDRRGARRYLAGRGLDTDRPIIGVHPGSGRSAPNWTPGRYAKLAGLFLEKGYQVLVSGSKDEASLAGEFGKSSQNGIVTSFGELSLRELAGVISMLSLLVSSSTGTMHMAAALGVPTVSMFCPLTACSPDLWGPRGNASSIVMPPEGFCRQQCPGDPHVCTFGSGEEGITTAQVFESANRILSSSETAVPKGSLS